MRIMGLILMAGLLSACGNGSGPVVGDLLEGSDTPALAYARRMVFVAGSEVSPKIVVFEHGIIADPTEVHRDATIWRLGEDGWSSLVTLNWTDPPIRDPWRLVPHGPLRIMVDDAGEVVALRGQLPDGAFRLGAVSRVAEWSPDDRFHFRVRRGEWRREDDSVRGTLVDILPSTRGTPIDGPTPSGTLSGVASVPNSAELSTQVELILSDGAEFRVAARLPAGEPGQLWLQRAERIETFDGAEVIWPPYQGEDTWRIDARGGEVEGELRPLSDPLQVVGDTTSAHPRSTAEYHAVSGWIEIRGDRRTVLGIVRREPT